MMSLPGNSARERALYENSGTGSGVKDPKEVLRRGAIALKQLCNGGDLSHVGDYGFLDGHALAFGTVVALHCPLAC
jgi:hypothetical protein